ncbi:MAG: RHS repeat-associated core domain-containing protein [Pseudomonadota bacterium]
MDLVFRNETPDVAAIFIIDGRNGEVLESIDAPSFFSTEHSFVSVADVDLDGDAELITSYTGGIEGATSVWTGTTANPMPPAPAFRNQWTFSEAYSSRDGKTLAPNPPVPHWLQAGRNGWNLVTADRQRPVELSLQCDVPLSSGSSMQGNATLAAGDVDNDGDIELVGVNFIDGLTFLAELWILNASDCSEQLIINLEQSGGVSYASQVGLLDIDGDDDLEIIVPRDRLPAAESGFGDGEHLIAIHHDGTLAWSGNGGSETSVFMSTQVANAAWYSAGPTFADLDADGSTEIVMVAINNSGGFNGVVTYNAEDGSIAWEYVSPNRSTVDQTYRIPVIVDLDLDGTLEIIVQDFVLDHEGQLEFELSTDEPVNNIQGGTLMSAVANFDDDPYPEIIARNRMAHFLFEHDGTRKWRIDWPATNFAQSFITVADFDGDGEVEYADIVCQTPESLPCASDFIQVYDTDGSRLWNHQFISQLDTDFDNGEGIIAFDANRDGAFDLVFRSARNPVSYLHIINGRDGTVLETAPIAWWSASRSSFPTIADVDGDGDAELITSGTNGLAGGTQIWGGTDAKPLPAATPFRNQWAFMEGYASEDGKTMVSNPVPHWLQPGLNGWHIVKPEPDPLIGGIDQFTYQANDGALDSNVATVSFEILPPGSPPQFITQPRTLSNVGIQYRYDVRTFDPDIGDVVALSLTQAPPGMTLDAGTGQLRWQPDATGEYPVSILATDSMGFAEAQSFTLTVGEPLEVPNLVGLPEDDAETALSDVNLVLGRTQDATHPTIPAGAVSAQTPIAGSVIEFGGAVDLVISLGPAPEDIDDDTDGFTENEGDCDDGNQDVFPGAADSEGDGVDQDCDGIDGNLVLTELLVLPGESTVLTGDRVDLTAIGLFENGTSQNLTAVVTWSDGPAFSTATAGAYTVSASLGGVSGSAQIAVVAQLDDDSSLPVAAITAPLTDAVITGPVDVLGTATDDHFYRYDLEAAIAGTDDFVLIASGTSPVTDGVLGVFDPTTLINDLYTLRLSVFDRGGNATTTEIVVQVEGNFKAGAFGLAYTDFDIELSGIPLTLTRAYDSLDRSQGLFGHGWRLDIQSFRLRVSDDLDQGWQVVRSGISFGLVETGVHKVSVTLPDGAVEEFDLVVTPFVSPIVPFPSGSLTARWEARPGTVGTLRSLGNNQLSILGAQPGEIRLVDDLSLAPFAPDRFEYRHPLGATVIMSASGGVKSIEDLNGNRITLDDSGLQHSSGEAIVFEKDAQGRITRITDPGGKTHEYAYDGNGDLRRHTDETGAVTEFEYQFGHYLINVIDPVNRPVTRYEYDDEGRLTAIIDAQGNRSELDLDVPGRQSVVTDRTGGITVTTYDERGNAVSRTDPGGNTWSYVFDEEDRRVSETNPLGETTTYVYDDLDNVLERTNALGHTLRFERDENGRVTRRTDPSGVTTDYDYDARGNLVQKTDGLGFSETWSYDERGDLIGMQDRAGRSWSMARSSEGRVTEITHPHGQINERDFDASGEVMESRYLVPRGNGTASIAFNYGRNERGQMTSITAPMMSSPMTTEYNAAGELSGSTDPEGNSIGLERDITGRITRRSDSSGPPMLYRYDASGRDTETVLASGATLERDWDARGLNRSTTVTDFGTRTSDFDALGRIEALTQPGLGPVTQSYDAGGRPTQRTLPDGTVLAQTFDEAGRTLTSTDPLGHTASYRYDDRGMIAAMTAADGREYERSWTEDERLASQRDALGILWDYEYDAAGNVSRTTGPANTPARFESNLFGTISRVESPAGRVTRYGHDDLGNPVSVTWPDGSQAVCAFDTIGRQTECTDAAGQQTTYRYDGVSAMTEIDRPEGTTVREVDSLGRLERLTNERGEFSLSHDTIGRLTRYENPTDEWIETEFDDNGQPAGFETHSSSQVDFEYDNRGLKTSATLDGERVEFERDAGGRPTAISFADGARIERTFDEVGRVLTVNYLDAADQSQFAFGYGYDSAGRLDSATELSGKSASWSYDALGRLLTVNSAGGANAETTSYEYDADGNVAARVRDGARQDYVVNENDFLLDDGESTLSWDANGNLRSRRRGDQVERYEWDSQHRLVAYRRSGANPVEIEYEYAFDGLLEVRRTGTVTETFTWDRNALFPVLVEHRSSLETQPTRYLYDDLMPVAERTPSGDWVHHLRDRQGSLRARIRADGTVLEQLDYNAWGAPASGQASPVGYTGGFHDAESGLIYLRSRWYAPDMERFVSRDSAGINPMDHRTINRFSYSLNDPLNRIDLSGQLSFVGVVQSIAIANIVAVVGYTAYRDGLSRIFSSVGGLAEIYHYFLERDDAKFASASIFETSRGGPGVGVAFFPTVNLNAGIFSIGGGLEFLQFNDSSAAYAWFGSRIGTPSDLAVSLQAPTLSIGSQISHTPTPLDYEGPFITASLSFGVYASNKFSFQSAAAGAVGAPVGAGLSGSLSWSPVVTYQDPFDGEDYRSHGVRGGPVAGKGWSFGLGMATYMLIHMKSNENSPGLF